MFLGGSVAFCRLQRQSLEGNLFFSLKVCRFCGTSSLITISAETRPAERLRRWSWWPNTDSQETGNDRTNGCNLLRWIGQAISQEECSQDSLLILHLESAKNIKKPTIGMCLEKCAWTAHRISCLSTLSVLDSRSSSWSKVIAKWALYPTFFLHVPQSCRSKEPACWYEHCKSHWVLQKWRMDMVVHWAPSRSVEDSKSFTRQVAMYCHIIQILSLWDG